MIYFRQFVVREDFKRIDFRFSLEVSENNKQLNDKIGRIDVAPEVRRLTEIVDKFLGTIEKNIAAFCPQNFSYALLRNGNALLLR